MREIQLGNAKRRKKRKKRSGGCLGRLLFLMILFTVVGVLGYRACQSLGVTMYIQQSRYPVKYQEEVEKYAAEYGLDEDLIYGVIHTESRFDPYAVSPAKAKGLMQVQDETAEDCARALKVKDFKRDDIFDPDTNIRFGCYYLKRLIDKYGHLETAVAAYNGGPGNVDQWLKEQNAGKDKKMLSHIPFAETEQYVERVMKAYRAYEKLYQE